jgi:hypothetical protein
LDVVAGLRQLAATAGELALPAERVGGVLLARRGRSNPRPNRSAADGDTSTGRKPSVCGATTAGKRGVRTSRFSARPLSHRGLWQHHGRFLDRYIRVDRVLPWVRVVARSRRGVDQIGLTVPMVTRASSFSVGASGASNSIVSKRDGSTAVHATGLCQASGTSILMAKTEQSCARATVLVTERRRHSYPWTPSRFYSPKIVPPWPRHTDTAA